MMKKSTSKKTTFKIAQDLPDEAMRHLVINKSEEADQWDAYTENIQPISQGRNFGALMETLPLVTDNKVRRNLFETRKK